MTPTQEKMVLEELNAMRSEQAKALRRIERDKIALGILREDMPEIVDFAMYQAEKKMRERYE